MDKRKELVAAIAARAVEKYSPRGGIARAPSGELNMFIEREIRTATRTVPDPFAAIIRGWPGQAHQLDMCWWEDEDHPEGIVLGLAGAILEFEVRRTLELPT
ncbi:hypothetical protein [Desulfuromonas sp.]|uniref:hypothetical protein n=1 Tax=Desulfuromonas sp. TaxID=892 RepID=UPI0025C06914|nr:hypothetical protein [Desulfuromonas sp.]